LGAPPLDTHYTRGTPVSFYAFLWLKIFFIHLLSG
jgi:hypothetical protein